MSSSSQSNPSYPPVEKVRDEITQTVKGMLCASVCPALAVYMVKTGAFGGASKAYCGGWGDQVRAADELNFKEGFNSGTRCRPWASTCSTRR